MNTYIPDSLNENEALARTTQLCIAAHHDDVELMASGAISNCFQSSEEWFTGVVMTDGANSPRAGEFAGFTDEMMKQERAKEQIKAAQTGKYAAVCMLEFKSETVKSSEDKSVETALLTILKQTKPQVVYIHNLADKHDTHIACALKAINALRKLDQQSRPQKLYMVEVWRTLDWLKDSDKTLLVNTNTALTQHLLSCFKSQIAGGKRYDLALLGRQNANATFFESHAVDTTNAVTYALDATKLIQDDTIMPKEFIKQYLEQFKEDVLGKL